MVKELIVELVKSKLLIIGVKLRQFNYVSINSNASESQTFSLLEKQLHQVAVEFETRWRNSIPIEFTSHFVFVA